MRKHTIEETAMHLAFASLAEAAKTVRGTPARYAGVDICTAVATLIAASGAHGSHEQRSLMDLAAHVGFHPEYYANSIRVTFR